MFSNEELRLRTPFKARGLLPPLIWISCSSLVQDELCIGAENWKIVSFMAK